MTAVNVVDQGLTNSTLALQLMVMVGSVRSCCHYNHLQEKVIPEIKISLCFSEFLGTDSNYIR